MRNRVRIRHRSAYRDRTPHGRRRDQPDKTKVRGEMLQPRKENIKQSTSADTVIWKDFDDELENILKAILAGKGKSSDVHYLLRRKGEILG